MHPYSHKSAPASHFSEAISASLAAITFLSMPDNYAHHSTEVVKQEVGLPMREWGQVTDVTEGEAITLWGHRVAYLCALGKPESFFKQVILATVK